MFLRCCCNVIVVLLWCCCNVVVMLLQCCCNVVVMLLWCCCNQIKSKRRQKQKNTKSDVQSSSNVWVEDQSRSSPQFNVFATKRKFPWCSKFCKTNSARQSRRRHSTEVAFTLLIQLPQVRFLAFHSWKIYSRCFRDLSTSLLKAKWTEASQCWLNPYGTTKKLS